MLRSFEWNVHMAIIEVSTNEIFNFFREIGLGKNKYIIMLIKYFFIFSSELGPIIKSRFKKFTIDLRAVGDYLSLWYVVKTQKLY